MAVILSRGHCQQRDAGGNGGSAAAAAPFLPWTARKVEWDRPCLRSYAVAVPFPETEEGRLGRTSAADRDWLLSFAQPARLRDEGSNRDGAGYVSSKREKTEKERLCSVNETCVFTHMEQAKVRGRTATESAHAVCNVEGERWSAERSQRLRGRGQDKEERKEQS